MSPTEYQELVEFLGHQFAQVDRRFAEVDRRLTAMDRRFTGRFDEINGHFDEIYRRLERLEQEYQAITQALRRIEAGMADERGRREILERDLAELKRHVAVLQSRIEEIEQRLGS